MKKKLAHLIFMIPFYCLAEDYKIKVVAEEIPIYSFFEVYKEDPKAPPKKEKDPKAPPLPPRDPNAPPDIVGSDVEIISNIMTELKLPFEIKIVKWNEIKPTVIEGKADIVLGIVKNKFSLKHAYFPRTPMRSKTYVFYGNSNEFGKQRTLSFEEAKAHNLKVGIVVGFTYPQVFWDAYPFENLILNSLLIEGKNYKDNIKKLQENKIDLFIADKERANVLIKKMGAEEIVFQYKNILYWKDYYCIFPKKAHFPNKINVIAQFERALYKMAERKEIELINEKWMQKEIK